MDWHTRPATAEDVREITPRLRAEDIAEGKAANGMDTCAALMRGLDGAQVVVSGDKLLALYGITPLTDIAGAVWMVATPALTQAPYVGEFLRHSRDMCDSLNARYPLLCNVVDERNEVHIRWLKWCGFHFINRHPQYGHEKRPFLEFVRIKKHV